MKNFTIETKGHARQVAGVVLLLAAVAVVASCGTERTTVATRTSTMQTIPAPPPPAMTDITFQDLRSMPTTDPAKEKVTGVIVNQGDRAVSKLSIRVEGLNSSGSVVTSAVTPPLDQTIAASGGRATFEAELPRSDAVIAYHAVALAK